MNKYDFDSIASRMILVTVFACVYAPVHAVALPLPSGLGCHCDRLSFSIIIMVKLIFTMMSEASLSSHS